MITTQAQQESTEQLEAAFHLFNQMSSSLDASYRALEARVEELSSELAEARSQRLEELQKKELLAARLSALVAMLPSGVLLLDAGGVILEANQEAERLLSPDLTGREFDDVLDGFMASVEESLPDHRVLTTGRHVSVARRVLDETGTEVVLIVDVTEANHWHECKSRERRLVSLGEMAARLAHKIRTPLSSAVLYLDAMARDDLTPARRRELAGKVGDRLLHIETLTEHLLGFVRGEGRPRSEFVVADLLEAVRTTIAPAVRRKRGDVRVVSCPPGATARGCRDDLLSVVIAIAENAVQMVDAPIIELAAVASDDWIDIYVTDNGGGVDGETRKRLFDPFYTTRANGTGLGLAMARRTAREHGGDIEVSRADTGGARFRLRIRRRGLEQKTEAAA